MFARFPFVVLLLLLTYPSHAQFSYFAGPNVDWVRAPTLRGTVRPSVGVQFGFQYTAIDSTRRFSPTVGGMISRQGYRQALAGQTHQVHFFYFTGNIGISYRAHSFIRIHTAIELSRLVAARYQFEDDDTIGVIDTYRKFRPAARLEVVLWNHKMISPYLSFAHDLRPALRYPRIDATGNFNGTLTDLWHRTLSAGVHINL